MIKSDNVDFDLDKPALSNDLPASGNLTFCVQIKKGALTPAPQTGSQFFEWYIITDPGEIDGKEDSAEEDSGRKLQI
jgi:hypothetical protein